MAMRALSSSQMMVHLFPTFRLAAALLLALLVLTGPVQAAKITIKNLCSYDVTACDKESLTDRVTCYVLNGGGNSQVEIDVGAWQGLIWGLPSSFGDGGLGYQALSQADLAEFTIGMSPPDTQRDYYAISNVNAYNLPLMVRSDNENICNSSITCDLPASCQAPNTHTGGPGYGCQNKDGPNTSVPTDGTRAFRSTKCPRAYTYDSDDDAELGQCKTGSNYEVVFCP